jgi:hypothetical protein
MKYKVPSNNFNKMNVNLKLITGIESLVNNKEPTFKPISHALQTLVRWNVPQKKKRQAQGIKIAGCTR